MTKLRPDRSLNRRQLLETGALTVGVAATVAATPKRCLANTSIALRKEDTVLFQGDSITDAGRDRKSEGSANHPQALGSGYPLLIASELLRDHPGLNLRILNRGISGNKIPDLARRWQEDCLDLQPAVLSVLIGVNDIWHKLNGQYDGTVIDYEEGLATLLDQTRRTLPNTVIVVCEPFVLRCGAVNDRWFPEFDQRRAAAKKIAEQLDTLWVPFQTTFDEAVTAGSQPEYWAGDGVHPTLAGHALMARAWGEVVWSSS